LQIVVGRGLELFAGMSSVMPAALSQAPQEIANYGAYYG
jgi:hypothetical protein